MSNAKQTAKAATDSDDIPVKRVAFGVSSQTLFGLSVNGWTSDRPCGLTCHYSKVGHVLKFRHEEYDETVVVPVALTKQFVI